MATSATHPTVGQGDNRWRDFVLAHGTAAHAAATAGDADPDAILNRAFLLHMSNLRRRPTLDVNVVSHCNLNCACCCYFSPISEPGLLSLGDFEHDLALLGRVEGVEEFFDAICLMGGEPLLHPRLAEFALATRDRLPRIGIRVVTNGLLLDGAPHALWDALRQAGAELLVTPYPVGLDYDALVSHAAKKGVGAFVGGGLVLDVDDAFFLRTPLDPEDPFDPSAAFASCPWAGTILQLRDGRIYPCSKGAFLDRLDKRFGTEFLREDCDSLDLASIASAREIDAFRRTSKQMCRYCAQALTKRVAWSRSSYAADEWLLVNGDR